MSTHLADLSEEEQNIGDPIIFDGPDQLAVQLPHSDAIVITINIGGTEVLRLLVDNGSSCDILFLEGFSRMGIEPKNLKP